MKRNFYLPALLLLCLFFNSFSVKAAGIVTDPRDTTICDGNTAFFTLSDTGATPMTFKWQISTDGGMSWTSLRDTLNFSGATNDTLWVASDMALSGNMFRGYTVNAFGADTSAGATMTVIGLPDPGVISGTGRLCFGTTTTLSSTVPGGMWTNTTPSVATIGSMGDITAVARGIDTVYYSLTNVCGTSSAMMEIKVDTIEPALPITGPTATCVGGMVMLMNGNTDGTWVWSTTTGNASVSTSGMMTGVTAGTDVISYEFTNGCGTVTSTLAVTVDTLLDPGTISGASAICAGSWISLSASKPGGMWFSGTSTVAVVDAAGNVTGVSNGVSIISYYMSNACGTSMATHSVAVSTAAATITGSDSVGIGATIALGNVVTGGMWYSSDTAVAKVDTFSGVVRGRAAGSTTITYAVTNACGTSSATHTVYVGAAPSAGLIAGDFVCLGSTFTLSTTVAGGVWSIAPGDSVDRASVNAAGVVSGLIEGVDTVYYTVSNAFGTATVSRQIQIITAPVVTLTGPDIVATGAEYQFIGIPAKGTFTHTNTTMGTFVSIGNEGGTTANPHQTVGHFIVLRPGTDVITYTVSNTCGTSTKSFTISLTGPSKTAELVDASSMNVFPNPTSGEFTINVQADVTEEITLNVTNVVGAQVKQLVIATNKAYSVKLNDQPAGTYYINGVAGGKKFTASVTLTK